MSTWKWIRETLAAGEDPCVTLTYKQLYKAPKKKPGRPKTVKEPSLLWPKSARRRCLAPRCHKRLREKDVFVCNNDCKDAAIFHLKQILFLLRGNKFKLPEPVKEIPHAYNRRIDAGAVQATARRTEERDSRQIRKAGLGKEPTTPIE
jgi:hypothetical protein